MRKFLLIIASLAITGGALSQNKTMTDTVFSIGEVEIIGNRLKKQTVGKLDVPLQYLPISVASVSGNDLYLRGIVNMQDAVKFLPNTRMRTTYGAYQQFEVRGFDHTPIMIDGVRDERTSISNSAPIPDLSSVESIELLKGPASVLYGHSTVGGIVNIIRKSPTSEKTINALLSYGSWDNKRAMMDFGGKLIGPFNYRAVVNWSDNEGYRYTNDKRFSGYLALGANLGKHHELDIRAGFNRDWYGTEAGLPSLMSDSVYNKKDESLYLSEGAMLPGLNPRWRYNNESDFMKNHGSNISVRYTYKLSERLNIENRLAYNYDNIDYLSTEKVSYLESDKPIYDHYFIKNKTKQYICLDSVQITFPLRFAYTVHTINEQLETSGRFVLSNGMKYNYLAGYNYIYFSRDTYRSYNGSNPETNEPYTLSDLIEGPGLNSKVAVYNPHSMGYMEPYFGGGTSTRNYTHGVYLQNLLELSDKLKVMLCGRYDYFIFKTATAKILKTKKREYTKLDPYGKTTSSAFTYRIGAVYLPITNLSVYGSFANFFMPYRDIVDTQRIVYIDSEGERFYPKSGRQAFKPQEGYQAEIGARFSLNSKLQATASTFYIRKENEKKVLNSAYTDVDGDKKNVVGQIASSESKGFELELMYTPSSNIMLSAGYGFTDAKIRKSSFNQKKLIEEGYMNKELDTQKGLRMTGIPKNTLFVSGNYLVEKGLFRNMGFNVTLSYTDNVYMDLDKSLIYPSFWQTDLGISYRLNNGIEMRLNVNNVFDDRRFTQSLGTQIIPRTPRNYLFTLAYKL